ncbi:MAG: hypothetical protein FVQ82_04850 [Planctomycetes bacterium]|nr:hypothetical protein [Planctomycetota bacterium]
MSILKANLKHLYQRRGLWFLYGLMCLTLPALILAIIGSSGPKKGVCVSLVVIFSSMAGLFACSMQIDTAIKPFSFCLPGHRRVKRQFLLIVAIATNLVFALIFLLYPGISIGEKFFAVGAAFSAGMVSFWIGVLIAFSGNASAAFLGFYPVIGIITAKYDLHIALEETIVAEPALICVIGLIVSIAAWMLLSCEGWFRRHCGAQWLGLFDAWNWGKIRKNGMNRVGKLQDGILSRAFENACLGRIRDASMRIKAYFAGTVYTTFGGMFCKQSTSIASLLFILVIVCAMGYLKGMGNMIFLFAGMMAVNVRMPVHSTMLISGGRRERFMATCFMVVVVTALLSGAAVSIALLTQALAATKIMGPLTIDGSQVYYRPISLLGFYVPFIMVPVGFALQLIFKRKPIPMMVAWVMFFMFCVLATILIDVNNIWWAIALIGLAAGSWVVFLSVLWWVSMKQSLVAVARGL